MALVPINIASREQTEAIRAIEPSRATDLEVIRPCSVVMMDGAVHPRVYCRENPRYSDMGEWINPDNVLAILPSPYRLPVPLARQLYMAGESGMGYVIYILWFRDGRSLACVSGELVDFPDLPEGYDVGTAVRVEPHKGRERSGLRHGAKTAFLDYVPFDSSRLGG